MRKFLVFLMMTAAVLFVAPRAQAACAVSTPMGGGFSHFMNCPDVNGLVSFAYQVSAPATVNAGTVPTACSAFDGGYCSNSDIGVNGDGLGSIDLDWGTGATPVFGSGVVGCPIDVSGTPQRVMVVVTANDGSGFMLSVHGTSEQLYVADAAFPVDATGALQSLSCVPGGSRPHIVTASPTSVTLQFPLPKVGTADRNIFTDCDSNSQAQFLLGAGFLTINPCADNFIAAPSNFALGLVYTSAQLCGDHPTSDKSKWTATTVRPDATGTATVPPPAVTQLPTCNPQILSTCNCGYIGGTLSVAGVEGGTITGWVQTAGPLAASPKATDVSAKLSGGVVSVSFRTTTEVGLAGINIWTSEKGKGPALVTSVAPKGGGEAGASYKVDIKRGAFKSGTDVVVETVTSTGERFKSDAVRF